MSTLHLPNLDVHPPRLPGHEGGWCYKVPETGQDFCGSSLSELMTNLAAHYKAAGYPQPPNLARLVEDYICDRIPDYCGGQPRAARADDLARQGWVAGLKHTFTNVLAGTATIGTVIKDNVLSKLFGFTSPFVEQPQANSRAAVCTSGFNGQPCPENVEVQGCTNCNLETLHVAVRTVVGSRTTAHDARLKACRVCICDLRTKVHIRHALIWHHLSDAQREALPAHCWVVREATTATQLSGGITILNAPPLT